MEGKLDRKKLAQAVGGSGPNIYDSELPHEEVLRRLNQYPNW